MNTWISLKRVVACILIVFWLSVSNTSYAEAAVVISASDTTSEPEVLIQDWTSIDRSIAEAIRHASITTEEFATFELNNWEDHLVRQIDPKFLDWYFSFLHQKTTEFGVPFAWMAFQLDGFLKVLRSNDEKDLSADEIIEKRMLEEFNSKFAEIVLNPESGEALKRIIERVGRSYASAINLQFAQIKNQYHVSEPLWNEHLGQIAQIIYNTGTQKHGLDGSVLTVDLATFVVAAATATVGSKVALNLAGKAASKLALKGGTTVAAKLGSSLLDPALAICLIAWDIWDYERDVSESRPVLRKNLAEYVDELKLSILENADGTGIMDAIQSLEADLLGAVNIASL